MHNRIADFPEYERELIFVSRKKIWSGYKDVQWPTSVFYYARATK